MAKQRKDVEWLARLVGEKLLTEEDAKEWARLALLDIPSPEQPGPWKDFFDADPLNGFVPEWYPLHEFVFHDEFHYARVIIHPQDGYWLVRLTVTITWEPLIKWKDKLNAPRLVDVVFNPSKDAVENIIVRNLIIDGKTLLGGVAEAYMDTHKEYVQDTVARVMYRIQSFVRYCQQQDKYLISVKRNLKPSAFPNNRKGQIARVAGPTLVYMNALPTTQNDYKEGDGTRHVKAHQRRGHHKTLRAERYKNHHLYQVEKGIYIRPLWVGDRSTIVNGTTYTVVDISRFDADD